MDSKLTPWHQVEWVERTWGELVELKYGKALKDYKDKVTGFPVFGTNGPVGFSETPLCDFPSVIIGRKGAYRGVHYSEVPFYVIDTAFYIAPKFDINLKWAYYELLKQDINGLDSGSAIPSTRREDFYALRVNVPPRPIQDRIADLLDSFNNKITLNRQINQTLEQMAQTLFKSWFVDFDPVIDNALDAGNAIPDELQARAEQRQAQRDAATQQGDASATSVSSAKSLPDNIRQLFPNEFEESELGWVPKGWGIGCLSDLANYTSDRISIDELTVSNYISTENMLVDKKGVVAAANLPTVKTVPAYVTGNILISNIRPYFKKIWMAYGQGGHSNDVLGFVTNEKGTEEYLFNLLYQDVLFDFMLASSKGSKMPRGDKKAILNWPTVIAPISLRTYFSTIVREFYVSANAKHEENSTLTRLRDTLLPKLISGELRLDDVESTVAEAITA